MNAAHGLSSTRKILGMKINAMLVSLYPDKTRKQPSTIANSRCVIRRVNAIKNERDAYTR